MIQFLRAQPPKRDEASTATATLSMPRARTDLAYVAAVTIIAIIAFVRFDISERISRWTAPFERIQLDEWPTVLLVLALGLAWFAARRYGEAMRALRERERAEAHLAAAVAHNRRLAQAAVDAQESERKAIARELHDELGQYVNVIKLDAVRLRDDPAADIASSRQLATEIVGHADRLHRTVQDLIRELRPPGLDEFGLAAAIEHCVETWRSRLQGARVELDCDASIDTLPEIHTLAVYRLVQEALTNVARHARARAVAVRVQCEPEFTTAPMILRVSIEDDGVGTQLCAPTQGPIPGPTRGLGLLGMRERVESLGGTLELRSAPKQGFSVEARMPWPGESQEYQP